MPYRTLNADHIERTIETLHLRISERFPGRGLANLCGELLAIAREDRERIVTRSRPNLLLRSAVGLILILGTAAMIWLGLGMSGMAFDAEIVSVVQGLEAVINILALAGAAIWFLMNLESNMRRQAILADLHELRSIAHVVDMHQLTKDPTTMQEGSSETPHSPRRELTGFQLTRYLDYCSEMLSLTGKLAALYMQGTRDTLVIQAVNEIEDLTGNLSRKIWQKIMILHSRARSKHPEPRIGPRNHLAVGGHEALREAQRLPGLHIGRVDLHPLPQLRGADEVRRHRHGHQPALRPAPLAPQRLAARQPHRIVRQRRDQPAVQHPARIAVRLAHMQSDDDLPRLPAREQRLPRLG
jgi:hypothetical protein